MPSAARVAVTAAGQLVARPFASRARTQPPADRWASGAHFGRIDRQLNPPAPPLPSSRAAHSVTAATAQSVGSARKRRVPYNPGAARNRLAPAWRRDPPPFASTVALGAGGAAASAAPYRTVSRAAQAGVGVPMPARRGFTNSGICGAIHARLRARVLG